jgi:hypothetical protein
LTLLPIVTPEATKTFWPRMQRSPIWASAMTWQKCQTFVPAPIWQGASTRAVG